MIERLSFSVISISSFGNHTFNHVISSFVFSIRVLIFRLVQHHLISATSSRKKLMMFHISISKLSTPQIFSFHFLFQANDLKSSNWVDWQIFEIWTYFLIEISRAQFASDRTRAQCASSRVRTQCASNKARTSYDLTIKSWSYWLLFTISFTTFFTTIFFTIVR